MIQKLRAFKSITQTIAIAFAMTLAPQAFAAPRASGDRLPIDAKQLRFEWGTQDGETTVPCTHKLVNAITSDWEVTCGDATTYGGQRRYTVHLIVHQYTRTEIPKMSYEVLFWVTDHQAPNGSHSRYIGSTVWFRLKEAGDVHSIDVSQDVETIASLRSQILLR